MRHFIAYHNPKRMGYEYTVRPNKQECVLTNKPVQHVVGNIVWVVTFKRDHEYVLASVFQVTDFDEVREAGFKHRISGQGHPFKPWREIKGLSWFAKLMKATGNLGFGLQEVNDRAVVTGLIEIAERDGFRIE